MTVSIIAVVIGIISTIGFIVLSVYIGYKYGTYKNTTTVLKGIIDDTHKVSAMFNKYFNS